MNSNDLRSYLDQELPREALLGNLVIYTINDGEYDREQIVSWFTELGLDLSFIPPGDKPIDAYRKATSSVDEFEYTLSAPDAKNLKVAHILVRDVHTTNEMVERHLIREIRDSRRRRLAHDRVGVATFYRPSKLGLKVQNGTERFRLTIDHEQLQDRERKPLDAVVNKIAETYDRHLRYLDGMKVRHMVREYVKSLHGIELKPSVYFIPIAQIDELAKVLALVDRLGHGCTMQVIGLMDTVKQRDLVVKAWQSETQDSLAELIEKIGKLRANRRNISAEAYSKIRAEYDEILERSTQYRKALAITTDATKSAAEMTFAHIEKLAQDALGSTS